MVVVLEPAPQKVSRRDGEAAATSGGYTLLAGKEPEK